jgi:hypothetical protein
MTPRHARRRVLERANHLANLEARLATLDSDMAVLEIAARSLEVVARTAMLGARIDGDPLDLLRSVERETLGRISFGPLVPHTDVLDAVHYALRLLGPVMDGALREHIRLQHQTLTAREKLGKATAKVVASILSAKGELSA